MKRRRQCFLSDTQFRSHWWASEGVKHDAWFRNGGWLVLLLKLCKLDRAQLKVG
jgi:hypothetical protein